MRVETVSITELKPDPRNVRKHPRRNIEAIKASLRRFGQQKPIVVDAAGVVRAGNGVLQAAKDLGWGELDVVRTRLKGEEAAAFAIADNRTAELARWDWPALSNVLRDMESELVKAAGWTEEEMKALLPVEEEVPVETPSVYSVIVDCDSEEEQRIVYEELTKAGRKCRLLVL